MRAPAANSALAFLLLLPLAGAGVGWAEGARPTVVDVPSRPAFVQPPGSGERPARVGESLLERSLVGTRTPGRLQVRLADGRSLRLGGDAVLRLQGGDL
ncbi:MAG: iron dicitrate transport regulator FecR, partial [Cyanobium sp.]